LDLNPQPSGQRAAVGELPRSCRAPARAIMAAAAASAARSVMAATCCTDRVLRAASSLVIASAAAAAAAWGCCGPPKGPMLPAPSRAPDGPLASPSRGVGVALANALLESAAGETRESASGLLAPSSDSNKVCWPASPQRGGGGHSSPTRPLIAPPQLLPGRLGHAIPSIIAGHALAGLHAEPTHMRRGRMGACHAGLLTCRRAVDGRQQAARLWPLLALPMHAAERPQRVRPHEPPECDALRLRHRALRAAARRLPRSLLLRPLLLLLLLLPHPFGHEAGKMLVRLLPLRDLRPAGRGLLACQDPPGPAGWRRHPPAPPCMRHR